MTAALREVLRRAATDEPFRDALQRDPGAALGGFALNDAERALLLARDPAVLVLLGEVLYDEGVRPAPIEAPRPGPLAEAGWSSVGLPEIVVPVRIRTEAWTDPSGQLHVAVQAQVAGAGAVPVDSPPSAWGHDTSSEAVLAAARTVREAPRSDRKRAILAMLGAMTGAQR